MAITLSSPGLLPAWASASLTATCLEIRVPPWSRVTLYAAEAVYLFNGVAEGEAPPAAGLRRAVATTPAAAGVSLQVGGAAPGVAYATICIASQSGSPSGAVEVQVEPGEVRS